MYPYQTDSRSVEADGKVLLVKSIMKRVPVHEEWIDHENKDVQSVTLDRTDREYVEPNPDKEEKVANDLTTRV